MSETIHEILLKPRPSSSRILISKQSNRKLTSTSKMGLIEYPQPNANKGYKQIAEMITVFDIVLLSLIFCI